MRELVIMVASERKIAIVHPNAAGGVELIEALVERGLGQVRLFGDDTQAGATLGEGDEAPTVEPLQEGALVGFALVFVLAPVPEPLLRAALAGGACVLDLATGAGTLVLVGVNDEVLEELETARGVRFGIPSPASTQLARVLLPLEAKAGIARLEVVSLEATSEAGPSGAEELTRQTIDILNWKDPEKVKFPHRVAFNLLPQVGPFAAGGHAAGEARVASELATLLGRPLPELSVTRVIVPVLYGHTQVLQLTAARPLSPDEAREALRSDARLKVLDSPAEAIYPMPALAVGDEAVLVGRLRASAGGLALLSCADNLQAALLPSLIELAEALVERELL